MTKITAVIRHRVYTYFELARYIIGRLTGKVFVDREKNYWGYIADTRKKNCRHAEIRKISQTKFYCVRCGSTLRYVREEISVIAEIIGIALAVFLTLKLKKSKR